MKNLLIPILISYSIFSFSQVIEEEINLTNATIEIPGTLTYPETKGKMPLVIFIPGSGNPDRNGNQEGTPMQASYIKAFADTLNNHKIAFYRYDKRSARPENIKKLKDVTILDFVADVKVAIAHFKNDQRFSGIHLIGHSQGSLVAMLAVTEDITSFISMAGAGQTIDKILVQQINAQNPELGKLVEEHFQELMTKGSIATVDPNLVTMFSPQSQIFFKTWASIDPQEEIKKLHIPILILNGDKDIQVAITNAQNLKTAQPKASLVIIPNMNHVMKEEDSEVTGLENYFDPKYPISTKMIAAVVQFISQ
ncbi:alpha/beta fold hydrolase [Cellulophaga sp. E16_2]|uniref:alpha/beta hydrolase n=1 Tax=Cellulophaga sp. E16_2 TaxID=2789297 RepID=UPI001A92A01F|nr:alpha/beta fold hydrolase [Cellulophaga sp. E16_2]MBO0592142.1 alpha/beta fold hydrolase [Cellulophaga sp. E16_2]